MAGLRPAHRIKCARACARAHVHARVHAQKFTKTPLNTKIKISTPERNKNKKISAKTIHHTNCLVFWALKAYFWLFFGDFHEISKNKSHFSRFVCAHTRAHARTRAHTRAHARVNIHQNMKFNGGCKFVDALPPTPKFHDGVFYLLSSRFINIRVAYIHTGPCYAGPYHIKINPQ